MAHYAFLGPGNIVDSVIVGKDENEGGIDWEKYYGDRKGMPCKRTSYNTRGGVNPHGTAFRKNFAAKGFFYSGNKDAFIPPQPYASWALNDQTCLWNPPVPMPSDGKMYVWDELNLAWINRG